MRQFAARHVDCMRFCVCGLCVVVVVVSCTGYGVWLVCMSVCLVMGRYLCVRVRLCGVFANRQLKVDTGCAAFGWR